MIHQPEPTQPGSSYTSTTFGHFDSVDAQGVHNYQLTDNGKPFINPGGQILCNYCRVPSHPRAICNTRIRDEGNGIVRDIHPKRGLIPSGNQIRREIRTLTTDSIRKCSHEEQEDPHKPKTKPPPTQKINHQIYITMNDNQAPTTSSKHIEQSPTNLMDLPTEIMHTIMRYLPFQDIMKLQRVNKRAWQLAGMRSLWKDITISNTPLSCSLISIAISKQVNTLNI